MDESRARKIRFPGEELSAEEARAANHPLSPEEVAEFETETEKDEETKGIPPEDQYILLAGDLAEQV